MLDAVILAAGRGARMRSRRPKVLHEACGRPLLEWVLGEVRDVIGRAPLVVTAPAHDAVRKKYAGLARFCVQPSPDGTGDALAQALPHLSPEAARVLVVYGDMPLLQSDSLRRLCDAACESEVALFTIQRDQSQGFGRVVRGLAGAFEAIVEERDCTPAQIAITEFNVGVYVFKPAWLRTAATRLRVQANGEKYLTDLPGMAADAGLSVKTLELEPADSCGINTRIELAEAERILRDRINSRHMLDGVTLRDPASVYIDAGVQIGEDTEIGPGVTISGNSSVGRDCHIGPDTHLHDSNVEDGCRISHSVLEGAVIGPGCHIGPFARLRPGARLDGSVFMGSFGEVKNSRLRAHVHMGHFSYIGDADVGARANIGAGAVTCNFDGQAKQRTIIEEDAFVGSDTMLVAPVRLGRGSRTGAGAVVTRDVPPGALAYGVPARRSESEAPPSDGGQQTED